MIKPNIKARQQVVLLPISKVLQLRVQESHKRPQAVNQLPHQRRTK
jgi:hypothetical protein